jgi:hypothetical protein
MKCKMRTWVGIVCLAIVNAGCSTAIRGTSESLHIGSNPEPAECVLTRDGETLGKVTTPGQITVKRDRKPIDVHCTKDGYDDGREVMNSRADHYGYFYYGPSIVAGVVAISALVDMASGANLHYHTAVMVKLESLSAADQAARGERAKPKAAPTAQAVSTAAPSPPVTPSSAPSTPAAVAPADSASVPQAPAPIPPAQGMSRSRL